MADIRPSNPRKLLTDAATAYGGFNDVRLDIFPGEIPRTNLPTFAVDPREEEQSHTATSTNGQHYDTVDLELIVYLAVESGPDPSDRSSARSTLKTYRNGYLTQLLGDTSDIEKTGRMMNDVAQGETMVLMDAITLQVNQTQIYQ